MEQDLRDYLDQRFTEVLTAVDGKVGAAKAEILTAVDEKVDATCCPTAGIA